MNELAMTGFSAIWIWPLLLAAFLGTPALRAGFGLILTMALLPGWWVWFSAWQWWPLEGHQVWSFWLLGAHWRLDTLSHGWLGLTLMVWTLAALHSAVMVSAHKIRYAVFFLLSLSGNLMWVLAGDAVSFYLGFSLMSLSAWGLVIHEGTPKAMRAGQWYLILALIGELTLFVGVVARAAETGSTVLSDWQTHIGADWVLVCLWLGLAIKVGVPLLHVWLPLAHPAAPVPASAVLSGVMIKAGVIGWWLLLPSEVLAQTAWPDFMLWLGVATMFYGALFGLMQDDPKTLLAYSSISQMGWLTWGLGWVWQTESSQWGMLWLGAFALHHGLVKAGLFLSVGWVKHHGVMVSQWRRAVTWATVGVLTLVLAGLPMTSGDWVKTALKAQAENVDTVVPSGWLWLAGLATALLMVRFVMVLWNATPRPYRNGQGDAAGVKSITIWLVWVALAIGVMIWPWWQAVHWERPGLWSGGLQGVIPIFLAVLLVTAWRMWRLPSMAIPPGDVLVVYQYLGQARSFLRRWHLRWRLARRWFRRWKDRRQPTRYPQSPWGVRAENRLSEWSWLTASVMLLALAVQFFCSC